MVIQIEKEVKNAEKIKSIKIKLMSLFAYAISVDLIFKLNTQKWCHKKVYYSCFIQEFLLNNENKNYVLNKACVLKN